MRDLDEYDIIFCDIDDTLIHGPFVKFMDWTWKKTHSQLLAYIQMIIQEAFNLFEVDKKLQFMLRLTATPIVFLTARAPCPATRRLINKIMHEGKNIYVIEELKTSSPAEDKANTVINYLEDLNMDRAAFFDDNDKAREYMAMINDMDCFDFSLNDVKDLIY